MDGLSRLKSICLVLVATFVCTAAARAQPDLDAAADPAHVLPEVKSLHGVLRATLVATAKTVTFGGVDIKGMVFNGEYGGPTLRVRPGDVMKLRLVNQLDQPTNIHFHGYRGSPLGDSDNAFIVVNPGSSHTYVVHIPRTQPPGLYWYHAHLHGLSDRQIMSGLSGMLVVEGVERQIVGRRSIEHLVFGLKQYSIEDSQDPKVNDYFHGLIQSINGGLLAHMELKSGETALWGFANEDADLPIRLTLKGHRFRVVARDGGLATRESLADVLTIPPAGRAEVLVDAGAPGSYALTANRLTGSGDRLSGQRVMGVLTVSGSPSDATLKTIPFRQSVDLRGRKMDAERSVRFTENASEDKYYINGQLFDHHRIDTRVPLGNVEEWTLYNDTDDYHAFHIHQVGFQVVEINGEAQPFEGYLDTVTVPERGSVKIRLAFTDPLIVGRFMYHCHVLEHEDKGMMGAIEVYDPKLYNAKAAQFKLIDQNGKAFTQANLKGKPTLMFFGYTFCPEICPLTLARMSRWLKGLGPQADKFNVVFVTVDPDRDRPAVLKTYLQNFDPRIHGLSGSRRAIDKLARAYAVYYKKVPLTGGGYSIDHSVETYVLDPRGSLVGRVDFNEPDDVLLTKLRNVAVTAGR